MFLKGHDDTSHKQAYIMAMESSRLSVAAEEDIYVGHSTHTERGGESV